jgi:hypothetical protein
LGFVTTTRYRCTACGNLTRFDVTTTRTTRAYHHYTVGGELVVEDEEVLEEWVDAVTCRWCGHGRAVELLTADVPVADDSPPAETADTWSDRAGERSAVVPPGW